MNQIEDEFVYPVDIGTWQSYQPYSDPQQIREQLDNLVHTGLFNGLGEITFIYTKQLKRYHDYLETTSNDIHIVNTETVLEDEIYYTSKIEGAKTTRVRTTEIHNGSPVKKDNEYSELMIKNAFDAVRLLNLYGNKVSKESLKHVWYVLTEGCRDNQEIMGDNYRSGDVYAGDFEAASFKLVPELMDKWIDFYNNDKFDSMPFIKASLLHYAFETIHPYCDGNGRLGRLMVNNYLIGRGIETARAVSISMEIDKQRTVYDASFTQSENKYNDCTPFLNYFMETMSASYNRAYELQNSINNTRESESDSAEDSVSVRRISHR